MQGDNMIRSLIGALLMMAVSTSLEAKTLTVQVDAKAGPWSVKANSNMKYGRGDEGLPVIVTGVSDSALGKVEVYATGTTAIGAKTGIGPVGIEDQEVDDTKSRGKYYPSFYTPKLLYPAYAHALVASFVNAEGTLVSRPVIVGTGVRLPVPEGATGLALGFNDASFSANSGALSVVVNLPDE
jgi:hypothetical protein